MQRKKLACQGANKRKLIFVSLLFCAALLGLTSEILAQNRNRSSNLELTDDEVNQYWLRAQALGYDLEEIPDLALSQGFTERHAEQLYNRIVRLQRVANRNQPNASNEAITLFELDEDSVIRAGLREKIFGMDVFERAFLTSFRPDINMATPESYIIGPGDDLTVIVYGTSQEIYNLQVTPQGEVLMPIIGPVQIGGLRISAAKQHLIRKLSSIYSGMRGRNPSVSLEIALGNVRTIRINIVGEVERPGTYEVPSYTSVFNALYSAGGPTVNGTFREIKVFRGGREIYTIDLYDYLMSGRLSTSNNLQDDDIIMINTFKKRIEVKGEIRRPALFEINPGESLETIIQYAGGFSPMANRQNILIESYNGMDQYAKDFALNLDQVYNFLDGDILTIRKSNAISINRVEIQGAVRTPGIYEWYKGLTVDSLIARAGGLMPSAFRSNVTVFRFNEDFTSAAMQLDITESGTFELLQGDVMKIGSKQQLQENRFIQVSGEVNNPGVFPFYEGITAGDIILLSSGLKNSGINGIIEIARRTYEGGIPSFETIQLKVPSTLDEDSLNSLNFTLQPLDHLFIRSSPGYQEDALVSVVGEVNHPGDYVITSSELRISDVLKRAGGFTSYAFTAGVALLRVVSDRNSDHENVKLEIDRLQSLMQKIQDEEGGYANSFSEESMDVLLKRIEYLRTLYEEEYLRTEEGVIDLLTIDANDGVSFSNRTLTRRGVRRDRVGIDISQILADPKSSDNLVLLPGDILEVPRSQETVRIRGNVLYTTSTKYAKGRGFKEYISQAGGYALTAKRSLSYVIYANGDAVRVKNFLFFRRYPDIRPGCQIIVPGGRFRQRFSPERIIALTSSLLTTFLFIENFANN